MSDVNVSLPGDKVAFTSVPGAYKPGESVQVRYQLFPGLVTHNRDWVGLFKVGWTSNRDYYTFEWAPYKSQEEEEEDGESIRIVKFSGSRLPPDDGNFYQLCYVTYSGVVKGASRPFQFSNSARNTCHDDLEVVEVEDEDSLLLLRTRHETEVTELQKKVQLLTQSNQNVEASFVQVKSNRDQLQSELDQINSLYQSSQTEIAQLKETLGANEAEFTQVKRNLQHAVESLQQEVTTLRSAIEAKQHEIQLTKNMKDAMKQELDDVTARVQQLLLDQGHKENEIHTSKELVEKLDAEKQAIIAEKEEAETQLRIQCSHLEERLRKLDEEKETFVGRSEYYQAELESVQQRLDVAQAQIATLEQDMNGVAQELDKEKADNQELREQLAAKESEANVMQQNICEMAGNIKEPRDQLPKEDPSSNKVDRQVLEALQFAYDDIESRYTNELKITRAQKKKIAEMEERVKRCLEQYEQVATENVELKKGQKRQMTPTQSGGVNVDAMMAELTDRREKMGELERELEQFQLKHDERIAEKNLAIENLQETLETKETALNGMKHQETAMKRSIEALNVENGQLKRQIRDLQRSLGNYAPPQQGQPPPYNPVYPPPPQRPQPPPQRSQQVDATTRQCPVCNLTFPSRMSQQDFERHVNCHFH